MSEVGRRVFVGSKEERNDIDRRRFLGSGAAVVVAAGSLGGLALAGQGPAQEGRGARASDTPLQREIKAQLRGGLQKLQKQDPDGARQLATVVRVYAATVDDALLLSLLPKVPRQTLLRGAHNHAEINRLATELGIDPSQLPKTFATADDALLGKLQKEGLAEQMRNGADALDQVAVLLEKKKAGTRVVALQGCQTCEPACDAAAQMDQVVAITCAASAVFPLLAELCVAASAAWLTFYIACAACDFGGWMFDYC